MLEKLKQWVVLSHKLERQLKECKALRVDVNNQITYRYNSARLQTACNEIEKARMAAGDLCRLVILGKDSRGDTRFIPSEHGCISTHNFIFPNEEADIIKSIKMEARGVLYETFEPIANVGEERYNVQEFLFYLERLKIALYDFDRALGMRLGEIYSNV